MSLTISTLSQDLSKLEKANSDYSEFKKLAREILACNFAHKSAQRRMLESTEAKEKLKIKEGGMTVEGCEPLSLHCVVRKSGA